MPLVLKFIRKWNKWYRVLRYRKGLDCWIPCAMAFGWRIADRKMLP
jgi:hypothetical protein